MLFKSVICATVAMFTISTPALAQDFDWTLRSNQLQVHQLLSMTAADCAEFGFEVVASVSEDVAARNIESQLLLSSNRESTLRYWIKLKTDTKIDETTVSEQDIERAVDGVEAAALNPANYERGEALYIEMLSKPLKRSLAACELGASDDFISANYWRGSGSMDALYNQMKVNFAASVERRRQEQ